MDINDPTHIVGMRIKSYRVRKKLSQEKLAELSNLHMTYIGQLERGEKNPTLLSLLKISDALDVPPETFISKLGNYNSSVSDIPLKAYNLFLEMDDDEARMLYKILSDIYLYKKGDSK